MNKLLRPPLLSRCIWIVQSCSDFPCSSVAKESACNAGDPGSIPGSGKSTGDPSILGLPCGSAGKESTCNVSVSPPPSLIRMMKKVGD